MDIEPYSAEQKRHVREVQDLWARYAQFKAESRDLVGGMQWKTIRGREYLYRYAPDPVTKKKRSTSLGPRTAETEADYARFMERRALVKLDLPPLDEAVASQARVSKALRLGRLPRATGEFLTLLDSTGMAAHLVMTSSLALHGYETMFAHEITVPEAPALHFMLLDEAIADDFYGELSGALPGVSIKESRSGMVDLAFDDIEFAVMTRSRLLRGLARNGDDDQVECVEARLADDPIATFTFDRSGRPVPISVPDPIAMAMMACIGDPEADVGPALAELATRNGDFVVEEHELEKFPAIVDRIGGLGPRI